MNDSYEVAQRIVFNGLAIGDVVFAPYYRKHIISCPMCKGERYLWDFQNNKLLCSHCKGKGTVNHNKFFPTVVVITGFQLYESGNFEIEVMLENDSRYMKRSEVFKLIEECNALCENLNLKM